MSWLGDCTRCGQPTLSTKDPRYREEDYLPDKYGYGVRHVWCPAPTGWVQSAPTPAPEAGSEKWYWELHSFIWSRSCGKDDCDESCYDSGHHGLAADAARNAGFSVTSGWDRDPRYRKWLRDEFAPAPPGSRRDRQAPAARKFTAPADPKSPIEKNFLAACQRSGYAVLGNLVPQHPVAGYRIDFALPDRKIGIELDGFASHSSTADIEHDRIRQRILEGYGWYIIRFGGREVNRNADYCAQQAAWLIEHAREGGS